MAKCARRKLVEYVLIPCKRYKLLEGQHITNSKGCEYLECEFEQHVELMSGKKQDMMKILDVLPVYNHADFEAVDGCQVEGFTKRKRGRPAIPKTRYRAASAYNKFIASIMSNIIQQHPEKTPRERMAVCAELWKAHKAGLAVN